MELYTLDVAAEVSGMEPQTIRDLIVRGAIHPAKPGGKGRGKSHRFSNVQILGLAAWVRYRSEGAPFDRAAGVLWFVSTRDWDWLKAELLAGRTFPVPAPVVGAHFISGLMLRQEEILSGPVDSETKALMKRLDLEDIRKEVEQRLDAFINPQPSKKKKRAKKTVK